MDPAFGMGVEFVRLEDSEALERYVREQSRGTVFACDQAVKDALSEVQASLQGTSMENGFGPLSSQYRVLLADDSKFLRSAYSMFLRREGFQVIVADDGDQALQLARMEHPDVIVLDLLMPARIRRSFRLLGQNRNRAGRIASGRHARPEELNPERLARCGGEQEHLR